MLPLVTDTVYGIILADTDTGGYHKLPLVGSLVSGSIYKMLLSDTDGHQ